jgi:hypothetical protein
MIVKDINEKEVSIEFKKLAMRKYREVLEVIESIKDATKPSETIGLIEKGLTLVVTGYDPETIELEYSTSMEVLKSAIAHHQVGGSDRKKSE